MASNQQFCLRWNNHQSTLISVFDHLLESGTFVDCTLAAEGQFLKAHKVVLSACSPYLEALLSQHYEKHPILILKDVTFHELKSMLDYMYRGEVNITQEQLVTFLRAAESLKIKGLTDCGNLGCENRDFERPREIENVQNNRVVDRSPAINPPATPKRMDIRKQLPLPRPRSPLVGLPPNIMINADHPKTNKQSLPVGLSQDINSGSNTIHGKEGSSSPSAKRKRHYPPTSSQKIQPMQTEEPSPALTPVQNNQDENHPSERQVKETPSKNVINASSIPTTIDPPIPVALVRRTKGPESLNNKDDVGTVSENSVEPNAIKSEVKSENVDISDEVHNDDSVGDLTADDDEEEMDAEFSRPGPSNASNSSVAAIPWHIAGDGSNGDDMLLAAQQEAQETASKSALECVKCHRTYSSPHTLRRHVRLECGQEPRFMCPYCPHRTKQRYNLMLHIGRTHRDVLSKAAVSIDNNAAAYH